jgi:hypothetical protein
MKFIRKQNILKQDYAKQVIFKSWLRKNQVSRYFTKKNPSRWKLPQRMEQVKYLYQVFYFDKKKNTILQERGDVFKLQTKKLAIKKTVFNWMYYLPEGHRLMWNGKSGFFEKRETTIETFRIFFKN